MCDPLSLHPHLPSSQTSKTPSFPCSLPTGVSYLKPVLPGWHVDSTEICEVDKLCVCVILEERNDGNNSLGVNHNVQLIVVENLNILSIENINLIQNRDFLECIIYIISKFQPKSRINFYEFAMVISHFSEDTLI